MFKHTGTVVVLGVCGNRHMAAKSCYPIPEDGIHWAAGVRGGSVTFPFVPFIVRIIYEFIIYVENVNRFQRK